MSDSARFARDLGNGALTFPKPSDMRALMPIPAANLRAQHDQLRAELTEAFRRVLDASAFIGGGEVQAFEREFAAYCGVTHAVGVANGTDALALALRALGVGVGDAVAVPAFTFAATAEAVCHVGDKAGHGRPAQIVGWPLMFFGQVAGAVAVEVGGNRRATLANAGASALEAPRAVSRRVAAVTLHHEVIYEPYYPHDVVWRAGRGAFGARGFGPCPGAFGGVDS